MFARRQLFEGLAIFPLAGGLAAKADQGKIAATAPSAQKRKFSPALSGRETLRARYFPNIELVTSKGDKVKFYDDLLKDKIVIISMMYARCSGVCPSTTSNLKAVRKILRQEVNHDIYIYSMTVKPEEDSPAALEEYARLHEINDPQWLFLTGKPDEVDLVRHKVGFADPNPDVDRDKSRHSGMLRYGNEPLSIWGSCQGGADPNWIAQEIGFAIPRQYKRNPRVNE